MGLGRTVMGFGWIQNCNSAGVFSLCESTCMHPLFNPVIRHWWASNHSALLPWFLVSSSRSILCCIVRLMLINTPVSLHMSRPAPAVRPVRLSPYHFSRGEIKRGWKLIGVATFQLDVSAVVRRTAHSCVCLITGHHVLTTLPKHSAF